MKAALIREIEGVKKIRIEEAPLPELPGERHVKVNIGAVGICGSDLHGFYDLSSTARIPGLIMGHEAAGVVTEVGAAVTRVKVGDRVAIDPQVICGTCAQCQKGYYSVCDNKKIIGSNLKGFMNGCMAEFAVVTEKQCFLLPDNLSLEEGAMVEPVSNAIHVLNRVKVNMGDTIVVIGAGTLGLCILQAAKLTGAGRVIVIDLSEKKLALAKTLGADIVIQAGEDPVARILSLTDGLGADIVIEAVGIGATYKQAISLVRKRGSIMFFGATHKEVSLELIPILHKELHLIGCTGAETECPTAIDFIASGKINVKPLITHRFALDDTQEAFETMADPGNNAVKVMLIP